MGWGRGRTCKSTGASLASKAGVFALSGCAAKGQTSPASPPPNKSGLGAAKSPLLSDLPRFKLRSFNQVMLRDLQAFGELRSGLQLCLTDTKEELPTTKTVAERNNFALKSASVSYLKIPAADSKPKRTMINYTTKAEYYLQKQNQITLIPTMEGKNTPPNKKNHRKHPARRDSQCMGTPSCRTACLPLLLSLLFVLEMEINLLFFSARFIWMLYFN